ncbi:MAG: hypothetical protein JWP12_1794 [Bacteroidetes bacterium]|nr:hypothetical protein [Bacteroidota bacterium]
MKPIKKIITPALTFILLMAGTIIHAQTTFYDLNTIQKIEITFTQPDWDYQMDTAKAGAEGYIMAQSVKINGVEFDSVGVKYKGNSSYNSANLKNPLHIALDEYKSQSYQGLKDVKLGNGYADPSMIREVLSYDILKNYMDCPRANFAELFINGVYVGVYSNDEAINKKFCSDHFYSSGHTLVKCNPIVNPSPSTKSNLKYIASADSTAYFNFYEIKSDYGWNDLVKLCDTVTNYPAAVSATMDMDRAIWMLAFNNVLINLDSYTGVFAQNYYLYKDNTDRYNPIVWDLNMSFGGFPYVGSGTTSLGSLTITNMEQLSPAIHSSDANWPLIKDVINNASYKKMYIAHMRTILNEMFVAGTYQTTATQLQSIIDTSVVADTNKFFTYAQFQTAMTTDNTFGSYTVPGISNLMNARVAYLQSTTDFLYTTPAISAVTASTAAPDPDSTVTITANVTNTNAVYLGYRFSADSKFVRVPMYDDGLHNDGAAADNVYGAAFTMGSLQAQYYVYAENANAGMFSPERAEHEFYTLQSSVHNPTAGEVVINEFMASNDDYMVNDYGDYEDWIELYNTTSNPVSLSGLYLTDNYSNPAKFPFPSNTTIPAGGYLIVWADQDTSTAAYVHANFKLSASGEEIMFSNAAGIPLDSVSFGAQTTNISVGRCPNGTGPFLQLSSPSFATFNCVTGIDEKNVASISISIYPNPANNSVTVAMDPKMKTNIIRIVNTLGQQMFATTSGNDKEIIDVSGLSPGLYVLSVNDKVYKKLQVTR